MHARTTLRALLAGAALSLLAAAPAGAQAGPYPSFQLPRTVPREFNFVFADADAATSLVFQWREGYGQRSQLGLDVGFLDVEQENGLMLGGSYARQLVTQRGDTPFDVLFTAGLNVALVDELDFFRVPVGASVGRRIPLEGQLSLTPYVHPKLVLARCGDCGGEDDTEFGIEFDLGADLQFSPSFSVRLSAGFGSDDVGGSDDAFGVSLAWYPGRSTAGRRSR